MTDFRQTLEKEISGSYTIERELGGGGMSRVFLANEKQLDRRVVIKVLPQNVAAGISVDRFRREIQLAAKLQHPHIVPVLASGEISGRPYFTMPFIEGESLREKLDREGEMPLPDALRLLRQVASALAYAHKHGIVHRDIKPANVMIGDEFALVTDFGVAKAIGASAVTKEGAPTITAAGTAIGTPAYMSPEQAAADPHVDHRADIYSLGVLAYEMLCGMPPFSGRTTQAVVAAHIVQPPEPILNRRPNLPPWVADLVMRCLAKRPADRPQTANDVLQILKQGEQVTTGGTTVPVLPAARKPRPRYLWYIVAGIIVALAVAATNYFVFVRKNTSGAGDEIRSVAVLPLVNVGGTGQDEYFSDGMSDELANALNKIPGLRVASRTSSFTFKGRKDMDVSEIGRRLNVQAVLEGTVRRAGQRLRVTGQLTSTHDGLSLWSDSYEREAKDVFAVQEDIARSIANALKLRLAPKGVAGETSGTENLQAYDAYLRGRYFWNARGAENLRRAITHFDQAIAADPRFARAYAARAMAYGLLPQYTDASPADALEKTRSDAKRALETDSTLAEAYTALGVASVNAWDWDAAEAAYRKAIALEPSYPTAHQWYGELLYTTSRLDSSVAETRRARDLDPLAPILATALGYALITAGRYDEALVEARRGLEVAPNLGVLHSITSMAHLFAGDAANARSEMEIAVKADPELVLRKGQLAFVYGKTGDRAKALQTIEEMKRRGATENTNQVAFAIAYIALGENDRALTLLENAVKRHDIGLLTAAAPLDDPTYAPVRNDPRFRRILDQMDLSRFRR
ncbi:MAG TPA: protein kinase [Gemmatimonadaceae bacterium]|nr:protein kinase [Gemmatimonadaceae bacterium]